MLISDFYANREIFITGGTGFLGKALIEKLLRDSPKIKVLYILLRAKKSLSVEERLEQFKKDKVFERIHQQCPEVLKKLHVIQGNADQLGLGIQPSDREILQNVSIIFHMAANVKFDDPLRSSILINTRGTYELVKIAETLKNLVVFLHCSTAYCNPLEKVVEEKVYKMPVDWRQLIKIAETYDEATLNTLCYKFTGYYPNTYTFTKNLTEQLIQEYSTKLPMTVFRPSIVISAHREPKPGWIDNLNGVIAGTVGVSVGILPIAFCRSDIILDAVPIDVVTKLTVVAAFKRGLQFLRKEPVGLEVINCVCGDVFNINMNGAAALYNTAVRKNPMENKIWDYDTPTLTGCYYNFLLQMMLMSIPLAIVFDLILFFVGRKPIMVTISRRIVYSMKATQFFSKREYKMINKNMLNLERSITANELSIYGVQQDFNLDMAKYFENIICGVKYYLFNQPAQATVKAQRRAKILLIVSRTVRYFVVSLFIFYLWSIVKKLA